MDRRTLLTGAVAAAVAPALPAVAAPIWPPHTVNAPARCNIAVAYVIERATNPPYRDALRGHSRVTVYLEDEFHELIQRMARDLPLNARDVVLPDGSSTVTAHPTLEAANRHAVDRAEALGCVAWLRPPPPSDDTFFVMRYRPAALNIDTNT